MNCEQFRALIGAEPNSTNPEALAHVEQCAECASYRQEMQAMDRLIYRALAVDAPSAETSSAETNKLFDTEQPSARKQSSPRLWRMAASLLITAGMVAATSLWLLTPRDSLAAEVIDHAIHEPASLVRTSHTVAADELETILAKSRLRLKPAMGRVSYAMSCEFRGHRIPHLVVQTDQGPVTVLVITEAAKQSREQIDEAGFQGVIVPAPRGVIVVLGKNVPVDAVANTVLDAV
jgi:hypothetical protein